MPVKKMKNEKYIHERISNDGRLTGYQVKVRHKGYPDYVKSFDDPDSARDAALQAQLDRTRGSKLHRTSPEKITLQDIFENAIGRLRTGKWPRVDPKGDSDRLERMIRNEFIVDFTLANLRRENWEDYIAERLDDVRPSMVKRELNLIRPIMKLVCEEHQVRNVLANLANPRVEDTEIPRIPEHYEKALMKEFESQQNPWIRPAAEFALETAARRGEMLRLEWRNYNPTKGTIWLQRGKNSKGRYILLTDRAVEVIENLPNANRRSGVIFETTGETLKQAIERARVIIGAPWIRWHDWRHEAISRLFEAGWNIEEVMDFSEHKDIKSLLRYRHICIEDKVQRLRDYERNKNCS